MTIRTAAGLGLQSEQAPEAVILRSIALAAIALGVINILCGLSFMVAKEERLARLAAGSLLKSGESLNGTVGAKGPAAPLSPGVPGADAAADFEPAEAIAQAETRETKPGPAPTSGSKPHSSDTQRDPEPEQAASSQAPPPAPSQAVPAATQPAAAVPPAATQPAPTQVAPTVSPPAAATATAAAPNPTATSVPAQPATSSDTVLASDYGSLKEALAALGEGQTLVVPAGEYAVKGPVYIPGDTELRFESGSLVRFVGSGDGFVFDGVSNVVVDGMRSYHESTARTGRNIRTMDASNLRFTDIVVERSGSIAISIDYSQNVVIDGYVNRDEAVHPGNVDDALNIRNSHNVTVRNFDLWVADDAISLKTMGSFDGETYNITIENGRIRSRDSGISFGSEITERIHDVTIRNVEFVDSGNPIYFKRYDESYSGRVEDVVVSNIRSSGSGTQRFFFVHGKKGTANTVSDVTLRDSDFAGQTEFQDFYFQYNDPAENGIVFRNVTANGEAVEP